MPLDSVYPGRGGISYNLAGGLSHEKLATVGPEQLLEGGIRGEDLAMPCPAISGHVGGEYRSLAVPQIGHPKSVVTYENLGLVV